MSWIPWTPTTAFNPRKPWTTWIRARAPTCRRQFNLQKTRDRSSTGLGLLYIRTYVYSVVNRDGVCVHRGWGGGEPGNCESMMIHPSLSGEGDILVMPGRQSASVTRRHGYFRQEHLTLYYWQIPLHSTPPPGVWFKWSHGSYIIPSSSHYRMHIYIYVCVYVYITKAIPSVGTVAESI